MMRKYFNNTLAQSLTAAVLLVAAGALWLFGINDEKSIRIDSSVRLDSEEMAIAKMASQTAKTEQILENYHHNLDAIKNFRSQFLKRKDERIVRISEFLAERARAHDIKMERVEYNSTKTREENLDLYVTNLPLVGRYRDIRSLIHDIEASDMFLIITELSMEDDSAGVGAVRMQLSLATYFEAEP